MPLCGSSPTPRLIVICVEAGAPRGQSDFRALEELIAGAPPLVVCRGIHGKDRPRVGLYATKAIVTQDFMPVIGVTLSIGVIFVSVNLIVDLLYGVINPKVRYE